MSPAMRLAAAAPADGDATPLTTAFAVQAHADPGVMPRVVELFAKRGLVPHRWHSMAAGSVLTIDVQIGGLEPGLADYIARCMRQIVGVEAVLTNKS